MNLCVSGRITHNASAVFCVLKPYAIEHTYYPDLDADRHDSAGHCALLSATELD